MGLLSNIFQHQEQEDTLELNDSVYTHEEAQKRLVDLNTKCLQLLSVIGHDIELILHAYYTNQISEDTYLVQCDDIYQKIQEIKEDYIREVNSICS